MRFVSLPNFWFAYPVTVAVRPGVTLRKIMTAKRPAVMALSKTASFVTVIAHRLVLITMPVRRIR